MGAGSQPKVSLPYFSSCRFRGLLKIDIRFLGPGIGIRCGGGELQRNKRVLAIVHWRAKPQVSPRPNRNPRTISRIIVFIVWAFLWAFSMPQCEKSTIKSMRCVCVWLLHLSVPPPGATSTSIATSESSSMGLANNRVSDGYTDTTAKQSSAGSGAKGAGVGLGIQDGGGKEDGATYSAINDGGQVMMNRPLHKGQSQADIPSIKDEDICTYIYLSRLKLFSFEIHFKCIES